MAAVPPARPAGHPPQGAHRRNEMNTEQILKQRGTEYGDWNQECEINQKIMEVLQQHSNFHDLEPGKQEALRRIVMKIARIVNGNSNNLDSWADIAGYA
ncbi:DUF6378 domain-containing protein, partial [Arthrospira platensis SPKY1]|nr:DUF6378 domain-containing protein [Arthrospira platensis SPKY1]